MGKKRKPNNIFSSLTENDNYAPVYDGLMKSEAFKRLTCGARNFYVACLVQSNSKQGKQHFYRFQEASEKKYKNGAFTFPAKHIESFGFKRQNAATLFRQLEEAGFIDILEKNGHRHKENVYAFSTRWKNSIKR